MKHIIDYGECGETIEWELTDDGVLNIAGEGMMDEWWFDNRPWKTHLSEIKTVIISEGITTVSPLAFEDCCNLVKIVLPETLGDLGLSAFCGCNRLSTIVLPDSNEAYALLDGVIYSKDLKQLDLYPAGKADLEYHIPEGVESIGMTAFEDAEYLESVVFPDTLYEIEDGAFIGCSRLSTLSVPYGVRSIGEEAFSGCKGLKTVEINAIEYLGRYAFSGCSGLESFTIPNGLIDIPEGLLEGCSSLENIDVPKESFSFKSEDGIVFSKDGKELILYPPGRKSNKYTVPETVKTIGDDAFLSCGNLESIVIPATISSLGRRSFQDCTGILSFEIPREVTSIQRNTFLGCSGLKSIIIPSNIEKIDFAAFEGCTNMSAINVAKDNVHYHSIDGIIFDKTCKSVFRCPPGRGGEIVIPEGVTEVGDFCFYDCQNISSILLPQSLKRIGDYAFHGCSSMTELVIPYGIKEVKENAFDRSNNSLHIQYSGKGFTD